jgi:putative component of toxin-antitoxin plasmid stabilization module
MAGRSGDTFKKRQKEVARAEKHREKLARRLERKQNKGSGDGGETADGLSENDLSSGNDLSSEDAAQSEESGATQLG